MFTLSGLMLTWPLWSGTLVYVIQAALFMRADNPQMALVFAGYSVANLGLIWAATKDF